MSRTYISSNNISALHGVILDVILAYYLMAVVLSVDSLHLPACSEGGVQ